MKKVELILIVFLLSGAVAAVESIYLVTGLPSEIAMLHSVRPAIIFAIRIAIFMIISTTSLIFLISKRYENKTIIKI
ncbi:MAG: hypothetical protein Q7T34_01455 [Candidatus Parcubacteria bacterium]|nr:hypothetical protein [Candidatus Parcubacteria bacterium]